MVLYLVRVWVGANKYLNSCSGLCLQQEYATCFRDKNVCRGQVGFGVLK